MTPQLTALVRALECPKCAGNGTLAWRDLTAPRDYMPFGETRQYFNVIVCGACDGDGLNPTHAEAIRRIERSIK